MSLTKAIYALWKKKIDDGVPETKLKKFAARSYFRTRRKNRRTHLCFD